MNLPFLSRYCILLVCVLAEVISCRPEQKSEQKVTPNLLFIFPDQLRNSALGMSNEDPVITPNIDQLAKEGMVIANAISNFPLCSPYRAMLMTGKLPYNNLVLTNRITSRV